MKHLTTSRQPLCSYVQLRITHASVCSVHPAQCTSGCRNGGTCTFPEVCTCTPGWTGIKCETGKVTKLQLYSCNSTCICMCDVKFTIMHNYVFKDINECNGNHQCHHECINVDGSYACSCDSGYELESDNRSCKGSQNTSALHVNNTILLYADINECLTDNGGCAQTCRNTGGSYYCSCDSGYELTSDNHTCTGM